MLSNAYFLAKFRFDTAENEPAKNLQILQNVNVFAKFAIGTLPPRHFGKLSTSTVLTVLDRRLAGASGDDSSGRPSAPGEVFRTLE